MSLRSIPTRCRLLIVVAIVTTFGSLVTAEFLRWDDWFNIWKNPLLNPPTWAGVGYYWKHAAYGLYIPVTYTAWAALAALGYVNEADPTGSHLNPYLFHAANIATHLGATLLVFQILLELDLSAAAACVGALMFGLHPVQVEPVAWTAGLKDVLAGALGLLATVLYLRAVRDARRTRLLYVCGIICMGLAMLAKPSAIVVPPMIGVIDWLLLRRRVSTVLRWTWPWLLLAGGFGLLGSIVQPATGVTPAPLWSRPLVVADTITFYVAKIGWPYHLIVDYSRTPAYLISSGAIEYTWIGVIVAGLILWRFGDRRVWCGALIFLIGVAPTSGAVTFLYQFYTTVADHYLYLPMLGVGLIAAEGVSRISRRAMPIAGMVLLALAARSAWQALYWHDHLTLFEHTVAINPRSFMAWDSLALAYRDRNDFQTAEQDFKQAVAMKPDYIAAREGLAELYAVQGRLDESIQQREAALNAVLALPESLQTEKLTNLNGLVSTLIDAGRLDEARKYQALAEVASPNDRKVIENRKRLNDAPTTRGS